MNDKHISISVSKPSSPCLSPSRLLTFKELDPEIQNLIKSLQLSSKEVLKALNK